MVTAGLYAPSDGRFLEKAAPALARCGHLEVVPSGLWMPERRGFEANGYLPWIEDWQQRLGVPVLAHGTWLDPCGGGPAPDWLDKLEAVHRRLRFPWFTDHLGACTLDGRTLTLPVPVPWTAAAGRRARASLDAVADIVGTVGLENSAFYVDAGDDATFLAHACAAPHAMLLDVQNLVVAEQNLGLDVAAWLDRAPLERVIEVHVAGGGRSAPGWLPSGATYALDSHDGTVSPRTWQLLEQVLPRLPAVRALTLERLEGTLEDADVPGLIADLERLASMAAGRPGARPLPAGSAPPPLPEGPTVDGTWGRALCSDDPGAVLDGDAAWLADVGMQTDGLQLTARLVLQQRFGRLLRGSVPASRWFERDPAGFTEAWRLYHEEVPPTARTPGAEARRFEAWVAAG
jgi:hypothetical protein